VSFNPDWTGANKRGGSFRGLLSDNQRKVIIREMEIQQDLDVRKLRELKAGLQDGTITRFEDVKKILFGKDF
jgi:hypothetical protein